MGKTIVFDTGSIISITMNNLIWLLEPLKERFKGDFCVSRNCKKELIDKPLSTKRFEFEALQTLQYFNLGVLEVVEDRKVYDLAQKIYDLTNNLIISKRGPVHIVSMADVEGLAATKVLEAKALVVDERTVRLLVEDISRIKKIMERRLRISVRIDEDNEKKLREILKGIRIIRSFEIVMIAYKIGLLDRYLPKLPNAKKILLDAVLWGMKTDGCAVSEKEIRQIIKHET